MDVDRDRIRHRTTGDTPTIAGELVHEETGVRRGSSDEDVTLGLINARVVRIGELDSTLHNRLENVRQVYPGRGDHPQDLRSWPSAARLLRRGHGLGAQPRRRAWPRSDGGRRSPLEPRRRAHGVAAPRPRAVRSSWRRQPPCVLDCLRAAAYRARPCHDSTSLTARSVTSVTGARHGAASLLLDLPIVVPRLRWRSARKQSAPLGASRGALRTVYAIAASAARGRRRHPMPATPLSHDRAGRPAWPRWE